MKELAPIMINVPFLIHPVVFGIFGHAKEKNGVMLKKAISILAIIGIVGVLCFSNLNFLIGGSVDESNISVYFS